MKQLTSQKAKRMTTTELKQEKERLLAQIVNKTPIPQKDMCRLEVVRAELARRYSK